MDLEMIHKLRANTLTIGARGELIEYWLEGISYDEQRKGQLGAKIFFSMITRVDNRFISCAIILIFFQSIRVEPHLSLVVIKMSQNLRERRDWCETPLAIFDSFGDLKDYLARNGRFAVKNGSESQPFNAITFQCTLMRNKQCGYRLKSKYSRLTTKWSLFCSGDHSHLSNDVARGMTGAQRTLVDKLISDNPLMSAYGIADSTRQYGPLGVDAGKVRQRMKYLSHRTSSCVDEFDGTMGSLKALIQRFVSECGVTRADDKPVVKLVNTSEPGRYDILITTEALLELLRFGCRNCLYVDGTFNIFHPHKHKVLSGSVIDGSNKYYTCILAVCLHEDKIAYNSLARGIEELMHEKFNDSEFHPKFVCADGLPFISGIWDKSIRLMCAEHVRRLLAKSLHGRDIKWRFADSFRALRRCPNSTVLDIAIKEISERFPAIVRPFQKYLQGGELGRWCKAQVPGLDPCVSLINNPSETGNNCLKSALRKIGKHKDLLERLKFMISVYVPEQSSRLINEIARVCPLT